VARGSLAVGLTLPVVALAGENDFVHPLLEPSAQALIAEAGQTPLDIYRNLVIFEEATETTDGTFSASRGVMWRTTAPMDPQPPAASDDKIPPFRMDARLSDLLGQHAAETETADIWVSTWKESWGNQYNVMELQYLGMIDGEVTSRQAYDRVRIDAMMRQAALGRAVLSPLEDLVHELGGEVLRRVAITGQLHARVPIGALDELQTHPDIAALDLYEEERSDAAGISMTVTGRAMNGQEAADMVQLYPLFLAGYSGDPAENFVSEEASVYAVYNNHASFKDASSGTSRMPLCTPTGSPSSCTFSTNGEGAYHWTDTVSAAVSDITQGQDAAITNATEREKRSFAARTAQGYVIEDSADDIVPFDPDAFIVTHSESQDGDQYCTGVNGYTTYWNGLVEAGVAVFNSDGNNGWSDPDDCVIPQHGSGMGVFQVTSYQVTESSPWEIQLYSGSSRGGTLDEGNERTIVDLLGPACLQYMAQEWSTDNPQYNEGASGSCGSSFSTPYVAGSAAVFRDWYTHVKSTLVNDPFILYTNLLLMGDRISETADPGDFDGKNFIHKTSGFDGLTGAGALRMKRFDAAGLDGPATWGTGSVCVDHGVDVFLNFNGGNAFSTDADYIKVVTSLYDEEHDDLGGDNFDWVDLSLQYNYQNAWVTAASDFRIDEKRMVFYSGAQMSAGRAWRIKLSGLNVSSDGTSCGNNSQRVYYSAIVEENDRDDDGPTGVMKTYLRPEAL